MQKPNERLHAQNMEIRGKIMNKHIALYTDKLNYDMEKMLLDMVPEGMDVRFLDPVIGKKGTIEEAETLFVTNFKCTREVIDRAPFLKLIQRTGVGLDNVAVDYATEKGIPVSVSKGTNQNSVAELAILLMLAVCRRLQILDPLTKKGEWHTWTYRHCSSTLDGKTVGIVGAGAVGREVIKRLKAFNTDIIYYDPFRMTAEMEEELGAVYYDNMEEIFKRADIVSLHLPYTPETTNLITKKQFDLMKENSIFVNTARGPIVNQADFVEVLKSGKLQGAAVDVYYCDPSDPEDPLFKLDPSVNLVCTPHIGAATFDNYFKSFTLALNNAQKVARGERPDIVVNEECWNYVK